MPVCRSCGHEEPGWSRFCTRCGTALAADAGAPPPTGTDQRGREELNVSILYGMVVCLVLALIVPPWETPPGQPPEFLGFHFILSPPPADNASGIVSRLLLTIELVTIGVAGLYFSWLFRRKS